MLICAEGGRKDKNFQPKKRERETEDGEKYVVAAEEEEEKNKESQITPSSLLPRGNIAWECSPSISGIWLINASSAAHTQRQNPHFW